MSAVEQNVRPVRATGTSRSDNRTPERETRARFADALDRREKGAKAKSDAPEPAGDAAAQMPAQGAMPQGKGLDFMQDERRGSGHADKFDIASLGSEGRTMPQPSAAALPAESTAPSAPVQIASSHFEIAARLDLPTSPIGAETHLTMTDPRWQASHAVVARDGAGGLSLDVTSQGGEDTDRQREELRARLAARGHRVEELTFRKDRA